VEAACQRPVRSDGRFVVYWMTAARRPKWNFALSRAVEWARHLKSGLLVVETLPCGDRWDTRRGHRFAMQGMADNLEYFSKAGRGRYYPYVARRPGEELELLAALVGEACLLVTDQFPLRRWTEALDQVARSSPVRVEAVDSCGLVPMRAAQGAFSLAHSFRRFWQRLPPELLLDTPEVEPLARGRLPSVAVPRQLERRWPSLASGDLADPGKLLERLPIDQGVAEVPLRGGWRKAQRRLELFLGPMLDRYNEERNQPEADATSGLSPYLHFGQISAQDVVYALNRREAGTRNPGTREQWWAMSPSAEAFLDELITWREVGFNFCRFRADYDRFESLPEWARRTLAKHAGDRRPEVYSAAELEAGRTGDRLWNAAQMQLVREGRIHNYLRMLWGKKILQWSASPEAALEVMTELNNRYALDGCDPNSYCGIFWILGRYDRAWGPERPIFGTIRYMSSENTARKVHVKEYLEKYAPSV
jgi:deoxyribodipyrimidine photo-lyase